MSVNKASLAAISSSPNKLEVFAISNDKQKLGQISFNGRAWSTWSLLDSIDNQIYNNAPSAVSFPTLPGSFAVFATNSDNKLFTRRFDGTSWRPGTGWQKVTDSYAIADAGNPVATAPLSGFAAEEWHLDTRGLTGVEIGFYNIKGDPTRYPTFYVGDKVKSSPITIIASSTYMERFSIGSDDRVYHAEWRQRYAKWFPKRVIGDQTFISPPTAVVIKSGHIEFFGIGPEHTVWQTTFSPNSGWIGWWWQVAEDRRFNSALSAVTPQGSDQTHVYALGEDGAYWHLLFDGWYWARDWESHGGNFTSAPVLVSPSAGVYDVFGIDSDGTLKHARHDDRSDVWNPAFPTWESLGGSWNTFA